MSADFDLLIVNGVVVTDTEIGEYDIAIKDEKIAKVVKRGELKDAKASKTIDAEGGYVMVRFVWLNHLDRALNLRSLEVLTAMSTFKNRRYSERDHPQTISKPVWKHFQ